LEAEEVPPDSTSGDYVVHPMELYKCVDTRMEFSFCVRTTDGQGRMVVYVVTEETAYLDDEEESGPRSMYVVCH
jgi:hypothetical protein